MYTITPPTITKITKQLYIIKQGDNMGSLKYTQSNRR